MTPGTPKNPKNPKKLRINNFQNMSCGVSLERYGPGEQFQIVFIGLSQNEVSEIKLKIKK